MAQSSTQLEAMTHTGDTIREQTSDVFWEKHTTLLVKKGKRNVGKRTTVRM
jgi:hypothetical protein